MGVGQALEKRWQFFQLCPFARIHEQRGAGEISLAGGVQLRKNGNQLHGQVVDAIKAHILKGLEDRAFPRAGKAGENDELTCFASCGWFYRARPLSFLPAPVSSWTAAYFPLISQPSCPLL